MSSEDKPYTDDTAEYVASGRRHDGVPMEIGQREFVLPVHGHQICRIMVCDACWSVEAHFFWVYRDDDGNDMIKVIYRVLNRGAGPCGAAL